jgi:hypothetical protein
LMDQFKMELTNTHPGRTLLGRIAAESTHTSPSPDMLAPCRRALPCQPRPGAG